jgi:Ser/Thr protein kinase RdoA (MazF antagonist)
MMKLKYLFDNPELAHMLLKNWDYDESSVDMFRSYRILANAIYPFTSNEEVHLLRFCPTSEKIKDNLLAELEFIAYLRNNQYPTGVGICQREAFSIANQFRELWPCTP